MKNSETKELTGLAKEVKEILEEYPTTRDDTWALVLYYRYLKYGLLDNDGTISDFIEQLKNINVASLTRSRRKIQELYPHLRGEKRKEREKRKQIYIEFAEQNRKDLEDFWEDGEGND